MTTQPPPNNSPLIQQVKRLRAAQAAMEGDELTRLVRAYAAIHEKALANAELLALELEKLTPPITEAKLTRLRRYKLLMAETEAELEKYRGFMEVELRAAGRSAIASGEVAARQMTNAALSRFGVVATLRALNPAVIEQLVGFLDPGGPLYKRLAQLPGSVAYKVSQAIIEGVGMGQNPRVIARTITRSFGMGLTDALRMMRTTQLWSYREASRASYTANSDIVDGWIWWAELDTDTCAVCYSNHGKEFPITESLDGHHNCRCTMLPKVKGFGNDVVPGADMFDKLSDAEKEGILGKGKFEAFKAGKFELSDLVGSKENDVYGNMVAEKSLSELLGE
jgi:SPP1 gp7 family putative phage head morphogenesis protein